MKKVQDQECGEVNLDGLKKPEEIEYFRALLAGKKSPPPPKPPAKN